MQKDGLISFILKVIFVIIVMLKMSELSIHNKYCQISIFVPSDCKQYPSYIMEDVTMSTKHQNCDHI